MGNMLRVTRESSGVSLEEASNDLNIKQIILENIEDGKIGAFSDVFQLKTYISDLDEDSSKISIIYTFNSIAVAIDGVRI